MREHIRSKQLILDCLSLMWQCLYECDVAWTACYVRFYTEIQKMLVYTQTSVSFIFFVSPSDSAASMYNIHNMCKYIYNYTVRIAQWY